MALFQAQDLPYFVFRVVLVSRRHQIKHFLQTRFDAFIAYLLGVAHVVSGSGKIFA